MEETKVQVGDKVLEVGDKVIAYGTIRGTLSSFYRNGDKEICCRIATWDGNRLGTTMTDVEKVV